VEFKISLLAPAHGLRFLAVGSVLRAGKRLSFCTGEVRAIRESDEELIATTIIIKPSNPYEGCQVRQAKGVGVGLAHERC
jgi:hypothetical protein